MPDSATTTGPGHMEPISPRGGGQRQSRGTPRPRAIVVDVDNVLVDTAVRKLRLLAALHPDRCIGVTISDVRSDYELERLLGPAGDVLSENFFRTLDTAETIERYPAPALSGAQEAIAELVDRGFAIVLLTGRPTAVREATLKELAASFHFSRLYTVPDGTTRLGQCEAKTLLLATIQTEFEITAMIVDRPGDICGAHAQAVPAILLTTTTTPEERTRLRDGAAELLAEVSGWRDVPPLIDVIENGSPKLDSLRNEMITSYSEWLKDLDAKANICVVIAAAVSAIAGQILYSHLDELKKHFSDFVMVETAVLIVALGLSVLSLLYAIQAYTSRRISGEHAGNPTRLVVKQWLGTLFGTPAGWLRVPGDALDDLEGLRRASAAAQAKAHVRLLYRRYHTIDPDSIANLRLAELRAANYQKVYPERLASKLLRISIVTMLIWLLVEAADVDDHYGRADAASVQPAVGGNSSLTREQSRTGAKSPVDVVPRSGQPRGPSDTMTSRLPPHAAAESAVTGKVRR